MLPVVNTMLRRLLDSAINTTPRQRACRFSSVVSRSVPANIGVSWPIKASNIGSIETMSNSMPRISASSLASAILISAV
ncbi:hypothetical protein D3C71_1815040 [compost metagenome]